jgi:SH3 domain protein
MELKCERIMKIHKKKPLLRKVVWLFCLTVLLSGWLFIANTWAETFYVSDTTLEAILRSGPGVSNRIIAALPIGTRVTVINVENGWAEVSLPDGRTGWTIERYLSDRPPWRFTAEKRAKEKDTIESQIREIESSSRELREANERLEKQLGALGKELEVTRQEYDALKKGAANYLGLQEAHEKLASELPQLKAKLAEAQKVHDKLQSSDNMRWFLYGAGTIVLGWILGNVMGSRRKKRSSAIHR